MKSWPEALRDGVATGAVASVLSTVVLALRGRRESGSTYAPTNAISHWLWGERAAHQNRPSARYTLPGYLIHHASSMLWATLYEKWFGRRGAHDLRGAPPAQVLGAAAVSALACFVDYQLTPQRLHPGFEKRLVGAVAVAGLRRLRPRAGAAASAARPALNTARNGIERCSIS